MSRTATAVKTMPPTPNVAAVVAAAAVTTKPRASSKSPKSAPVAAPVAVPVATVAADVSTPAKQSKPRATKAATVDASTSVAAPVTATAPAPVVATSSKRRTKAAATAATAPVVASDASATVPAPVAASNVAAAPVATPVAVTTGRSRKPKSETAKPKRVINTEPTDLDQYGQSISAARVRTVFMSKCINRREHAAIEEIEAASGKPHKPRATKENPDPAYEHPPVKPLDQLSAETQALIAEAEAAYATVLHNKYESEQLDKMDADTRDRYKTERRMFLKDNSNGDIREFNRSFDTKFYAGYDAFVAADRYTLGKHRVTKHVVQSKDKVAGGETVEVEVTPHSRAQALVAKLQYRVNMKQSRFWLTALLDLLVEQYCENGVHHTVRKGQHCVQLESALDNSDGAAQRVTLAPLVRNLPHYVAVEAWMQSGAAAGAPYPDPGYDRMLSFDNYVNDICKSVRMRLAAAAPEADRDKYLSVSVGSRFRSFCSNIVYETIIAVGKMQLECIKLARTRTIDSEHINTAICCTLTGVQLPHEPLFSVMRARVAKLYATQEASAKAVDLPDDAAEEDEVDVTLS